MTIEEEEEVDWVSFLAGYRESEPIVMIFPRNVWECGGSFYVLQRGLHNNTEKDEHCSSTTTI